MTVKVEVEARRASDGVWGLIIKVCPLCGRRHLHGGGNGDTPYYGYRAVHCVNGTGDYDLVPLTPPPLREGDEKQD